MRQTSSVLYIDVDSLIPERGKSIAGFDEFTASLDHAGIPAVWLTRRSRLQFDEARRKLGHAHPFIAEDGCCVCMPQDYFHVRPAKTVRLGRFTCIPVAEPLPAASEALQKLGADTGATVVPLRALSSRELVENTGLPRREAELARQRDFDELFFFAGASDEDIQRVLAEAHNRKLLLRQHGVLWSIAIGASVQRCIDDLSKLYDRGLRRHAHVVGIATSRPSKNLFPHCERGIVLADLLPDEVSSSEPAKPVTQTFLLHAPDTWERVFEAISTKKR